MWRLLADDLATLAAELVDEDPEFAEYLPLPGHGDNAHLQRTP